MFEGSILKMGSPEELASDKMVRKVYTAKNGASYIKLANGQCRFISKQQGGTAPGYEIEYRPRKGGKMIKHSLQLRKNKTPYWKAEEKIPKRKTNKSRTKRKNTKRKTNKTRTKKINRSRKRRKTLKGGL